MIPAGWVSAAGPPEAKLRASQGLAAVLDNRVAEGTVGGISNGSGFSLWLLPSQQDGYVKFKS